MPLTNENTTWQQVVMVALVVAIVSGLMMLVMPVVVPERVYIYHDWDAVRNGAVTVALAVPLFVLVLRSHKRARAAGVNPGQVRLNPWIQVALGAAIAFGGVFATAAT